VHRPLSEEAPLRLGAPGQRRQGGAQVRCGIPEPFGRITCQFRVEYSVVAVHPADTYPAVANTTTKAFDRVLVVNLRQFPLRPPSTSGASSTPTQTVGRSPR